MSETGTTQTMLSRVSGVHQPSISQFLSGKVDLSDEQLDRLLSCMGYRLEVVRRPVEPELTHSEHRSWMLHRRLSFHLTKPTFEEWQPRLLENLERLRGGVRGRVHTQNVERWTDLVSEGEILDLHRAMTGLDRRSIEMREVSPFSGLLPDSERLDVLRELRRAG
ncbi:UNVERIFIED_CONTAM: DNA-binding protein [Mumia flava]